jgi:glucosamine--fructose-6-phosphate aminotransferase (isomerizing)
MCGIIGTVGQPDETMDVLVTGLENLEYRGYDSAGVAVADETITVEKHQGEIENLTRALDQRQPPLEGTLGIGHTRWSTHGPPADENSHPHTDEAGRVAVVHNGIIENFQALKSSLRADGVTFTSDTDTEVVPHLLARYLDAGHDPESAFRETIDRLEGSFALAAIFQGHDAILAARDDSPLVLGIGEAATYLRSSNTRATWSTSTTVRSRSFRPTTGRSRTRTAPRSTSPSKQSSGTPSRRARAATTTT